MFHNILRSAIWFYPYLTLSAMLSGLFGIALNGQFGRSSAQGRSLWWLRALASGFVNTWRATAFFFMFSVFGVATAYFMSLGIHQQDLQYQNPLIESFATPFVALLTAGVAYFARKDSDGDDMVIVPAGVVCFLLVCCLTYRAIAFSKVDAFIAARTVQMPER